VKRPYKGVWNRTWNLKLKSVEVLFENDNVPFV